MATIRKVGVRVLPLVVTSGVLLMSSAALPASQEGTVEVLPELARVVRIFATEDGEELGLSELLERLAGAEAVFLGETHLDEVTHRFELATYEGLVARRGGRVVLAMEMFERDVQGVLDDYLAGKIPEAQFLTASRPWSNYASDYRPLIEAAKHHGLPVVASNTPRDARRRIAMGGKDAYQEILSQNTGFLPPVLYPNSEEYWERMARSVRGHAIMIMGGSPDQRLTSGQSVWDNTMGFSCAEALEKYPDSLVLHVNGGFHSGHRLGTVEQLLARRPETLVATVQISTSSDLSLATVDPERDHDYADYVVFTEERARSLSEGTHAVMVERELTYRLHLPHDASAGQRVPLLVFFPDDGVPSEDAATLWRLALGDAAAIAVVEPYYPQMEEELYRGGRWYWAETFDKDQGDLLSGLQRLVTYVTQHFPVAAGRVVLAGEGTGATVVAAASLYTQLEVPIVAVRPRLFQKVREIPLPDAPAGVRELRVLVAEGDREWWEKEVEDYRRVGFEGSVAVHDAAAIDGEAEGLLRSLLGLEPRAESPASPPVLLVLFNDTPLAREWGRLQARAMERNGQRAIVVLASELGAWAERERLEPARVKLLAFSGEIPASFVLPPSLGGTAPASLGARGPADLASGEALPLAPNPFGGTTVLVVVGDPAPEERAAWLSLEQENVIKKRSRFASLKVAFEHGERTIAQVLEEIRSQGRSVAHIVPAVFCADARLMRALRDAAQPYAESMEITWLPGLGGELAATE
ncbi:MAG: ChaN family lipoprotein [Planctomycetota bacterium]